METIVGWAALITSIGAFASSMVAIITIRNFMRQMDARASADEAQAKKTHSEIEWERLDLVVKYWKELSESVSGRLAKVEQENEHIRIQLSRQTIAFDYVTAKVVGQYAEVVKIAREIWEGRITQGAG